MQFWQTDSEQYVREQYRRPKRTEQVIYSGETRVARESDLKDVLHGDSPVRLEGATLLLEDPDSRGTRFQPTIGDIHLSLEDHTIVTGSTGSGKSERFIMPAIISILKHSPETIIHVVDFKQSLGPRLNFLVNHYRPWEQFGYLNFTDIRRSRAISLLCEVNDIQSAMRFSTEICKSIGLNEDNPFWRLSSEDLLSGLFMICRRLDSVATMAEVRRILKLGVGEFKKWAQQHHELDPTGSVKRFADFLSGGSHNAETIMQTAANAFNIFLDNAIAQLTGRRDLSIEQMVSRPGGVFLFETPETDAKRLEPLTNIVNDLITEYRLKPGNHRVPMVRVIDELNLMGTVTDLPIRLNTFRERNTTIIAAQQSLSQLHSRYGVEANDVLAAFKNKVFLSPCSYSDAELASGESGLITVETHQADGAIINAGSPIVRPLLLPEEIVRPPEHPASGRPATFFLGHRQPFQALLAPAWEALAGRELPIPDRPVQEPVDRFDQNFLDTDSDNGTGDSSDTETTTAPPSEYQPELFEDQSEHGAAEHDTDLFDPPD